jgi:hypothetical protein
MNCRVVPLSPRDRVASAQLVSGYLDRAIAQLRKYKAWSGGFGETLARAKKESADIAPQLVWQDELVEFWQPFTSIQLALIGLYEQISEANVGLGDLLEAYIDPPDSAQIEAATEDAQFLERDGHGRKQIAYNVRRIEQWHQNFNRWLGTALRELQSARSEI